MIARGKARIHDVIYVSNADINCRFGQLISLARIVIGPPQLARMGAGRLGETSGFRALMLSRQSGREEP
jgi:hypothetical protein